MIPSHHFFHFICQTSDKRKQYITMRSALIPTAGLTSQQRQGASSRKTSAKFHPRDG